MDVQRRECLIPKSVDEHIVPVALQHCDVPACNGFGAECKEIAQPDTGFEPLISTPRAYRHSARYRALPLHYCISDGVTAIWKIKSTRQQRSPMQFRDSTWTSCRLW